MKFIQIIEGKVFLRNITKGKKLYIFLHKGHIYNVLPTVRGLKFEVIIEKGFLYDVNTSRDASLVNINRFPKSDKVKP